MRLDARTGPPSSAVPFPSWQLAVAEFGLALNGVPAQLERSTNLPFEIGIVGVSGVGKSSLLNALIAPTHELLPAGGVGPLTGVPVRIRYSPTATLRVRYLDRLRLQNALDNQRGEPAAAWSSDLRRLSLACRGNQYASRELGWLEQAMRYAFDPNVAIPPDETRVSRDALRAICDILNQHDSVHQWDSPSPDGAFFRRIHEHISGPVAALCESIEIGWPSAVLETGMTIVDLPGIGTVNDEYAHHADTWIDSARAIILVTDRAGIPESIAACLRRTGFLHRLVNEQADLIGVVTKLDQVTDDLRRAERSVGSCGPWSRCFRSIVDRAEAELRRQIDGVLRHEHDHQSGTGVNESLQESVRVFGVSSREHQRVVQHDEEQLPRLHLAESSGVPGVRRALAALARLRSSPWTSELLDRVRTNAGFATLLPELISLVDME